MRRGQKTSEEQVVLKLRQIEVQTAQGKSLALACKEAEIFKQSYYCWREEYGGLHSTERGNTAIHIKLTIRSQDTMNRSQQILQNFTKEARLVEIGPSINPIAPKREGWNTVVIDHASREELVHKYASESGADTAQIEDVDFVWRGGSLADVVPKELHGTFDAFIASHVIEHTTDVITFLKSAETLVHESGTVILIVPDKRKCFDIYRHPSTTGDAIEAFDRKQDRHQLRTHFEYYMRSAHKSESRGWDIDDTRDITLSTSFEFARVPLDLAARQEYIDAHNWIFVPSSFDLMLTELSALEYLDLRAERIVEARSTEFQAWLRKGREGLPPLELQSRRKLLMDRIVVELSEQSRQIRHDTLATLPSGRHALDSIAEANARTEAVQIVLSSVLESQTWHGINRKKFKRLIAEAARTTPNHGPASAMHYVLLTEANKVLNRGG